MIRAGSGSVAGSESKHESAMWHGTAVFQNDDAFYLRKMRLESWVLGKGPHIPVKQPTSTWRERHTICKANKGGLITNWQHSARLLGVGTSSLRNHYQITAGRTDITYVAVLGMPRGQQQMTPGHLYLMGFSPSFLQCP